MSKREYTHIQELLPEIRAMLTAGKTQREIAEHYGFKDKYVGKKALKRQRDKDTKIVAGIKPQSKGRQCKDGLPRSVIAEQEHEMCRLKRENELLRDFLRRAGRR